MLLLSNPECFGIPQQDLSEVYLRVANGYGSTNTAIRRFSTVARNVGTSIIYKDSATLGASLTIAVGGIYAISYTEQFDGPGNFGITLNSKELTTNIAVVLSSTILAASNTPGANLGSTVVAITRLFPNDIVRPHGQTGNITGGATWIENFRITKLV